MGKDDQTEYCPGPKFVVPKKNEMRPNARNARPAVEGPRDVLRYAQAHQMVGDLGSPPTDWMQGSQSPASPTFTAGWPAIPQKVERKDPRPGTMQPLLARSPTAKWTGTT